MVPQGSKLVSFSLSAEFSTNFVANEVGDNGYLYAIDTAGFTFADAKPYIRDDELKAMIAEAQEWLTADIIPFNKIIGWKMVTGGIAAAAWTKNTAYVGSQCLSKRGLNGGGCALTLPQKPATTQQNPSTQQRPPTQKRPVTQKRPSTQQKTSPGGLATAGRSRTAALAPASNNRIMTGRIDKASRRAAVGRSATPIKGL
ncbi:hypothetical protein MCOR25_010675 [Pyricularia grisea]|nr:hypothetical protein MCOR25_010675 [Pyricularia grisea]